MEALSREGQNGLIWEQMKAPIIVPILKLGVIICLGMSLMLFIERVYMGIVITFVKLFGKKPEKRYKWEAIKEDLELGTSVYPMVLIQIPMYNEKEVTFPFLFFDPLFFIIYSASSVFALN